MRTWTTFIALAALQAHSTLVEAIPSSWPVLPRNLNNRPVFDLNSRDAEPSGRHPVCVLDFNNPLLTSEGSVDARVSLGVAQVFGDLLPRAAAPSGSCNKCTWEFCTTPTKNYRDQSDCQCKPCKNTNSKPDPETNDRCIPDCQGKQAAIGPKDSNGESTCKDCPSGQKPDEDHSSCVKGDCPEGQVPDGTATNPDGTRKCKKCPNGQKPDATGDKCVKNDCPDGQVPDGTGTNADGSQKCKKCPQGQKPDAAGEKCVRSDCPTGQVPNGDSCKKCPTDQKPDPTGQKCIPKDDNDDEDRNCPPGQMSKPGGGGCVNDKTKKDNALKKELSFEQKAWDAQDKKNKVQQEDEDRDKENDEKRKRVGKCLPIGALALESHMFIWATAIGGFMPQFIEELNLADYWPSDIPTVPMDVPIETDPDAYTKQWMDMANHQHAVEAIGACMNPYDYSCTQKRDDLDFEEHLDNDDDEVSAHEGGEKQRRESVNHIMIPYSQEVASRSEKRFLALIIDAILMFLRAATSALRLIATSARAVLSNIAKKGINLASRTARNWAKDSVKKEMDIAGKRVRDGKYFKNCLKGEKLPDSAIG
ncbi:MAG: hypothetical protein Q9160_001010 [Pyrenula sp. 1 TL-2023]